MICIPDVKFLACLYPNLMVILQSIVVTNSVALTSLLTCYTPQCLLHMKSEFDSALMLLRQAGY